MMVRAPQISREHGFALVELVVIVALVFILAAFAVPRFVTLDVELRSSATTKLGNHLRSQAARAHALWLAQGQPDVIVMDGERIAIRHGYPELSAIIATLDDADGFVVSRERGSVVFSRSRDGEATIANCEVHYAGAVSPVLAPRISIDTSGC